MSTKSVFLFSFLFGGMQLAPSRVRQCTIRNFNILQWAAVHTTCVRTEDILVRADDMEMRSSETRDSWMVQLSHYVSLNWTVSIHCNYINSLTDKMHTERLSGTLLFQNHNTALEKNSGILNLHIPCFVTVNTYIICLHDCYVCLGENQSNTYVV